MLVRCTRENPTTDEARHLAPHFRKGKQVFHVDREAEYVVFGIRVLDGQPWLEILSDSGYLHGVPLVLFEVIEPSVSRLWKLSVHRNGMITLWPSLFRQPFFHDDLMEGVPEVVDAFSSVRQALEEEALSAAAEADGAG